MCSPLRTYNMSNHHSYTQHTAFKPHILHLIHILKSLPKVQNHNASTSNNMPFRHLPKPTRDPINISQTVYFFTLTHLFSIKPNILKNALRRGKSTVHINKT